MISKQTGRNAGRQVNKKYFNYRDNYSELPSSSFYLVYSPEFTWFIFNAKYTIMKRTYTLLSLYVDVYIYNIYGYCIYCMSICTCVYLIINGCLYIHINVLHACFVGLSMYVYVSLYTYVSLSIHVPLSIFVPLSI